ncbi:hypothetical protein Q2941_40990 [Bradyrhizobium sp. UFLA05-153]
MNLTDPTNSIELPPVLHKPASRLPWVVGLLAVIFGLCAGGVYFGNGIDKLLGTSAAPENLPMQGLSPEDKAVLSEIRSGQQEISEEITELKRNISAQQEGLKQISDQIAALTSNIQSLQNPPVVTPPSPAPNLPPARTVSKPAARAIPPSRPEGPVSIGGAPLISEPGTQPH